MIKSVYNILRDCWKKIIYKYRNLVFLFKLLFPCFLMYLSFVSPSIQLNPEVKKNLFPKFDKDSYRELLTLDEKGLNVKGQFLLEECRKSIKEIEMLQQHESDWFELKFIFVGGVMAIFVAYLWVIMSREKGIGSKISLHQKTLRVILSSPITLSVLSVSFFISLSIDMHIRAIRHGINQNGIWIAEFIEPALFGRTVGNSFIGWEQFLRIGKALGHTATHVDFGYRFTYWPHIFYSTIVIYGCYLFCLRPEKLYEDKEEVIHPLETKFSIYSLARAQFYLVHLSLVFCAATTHYVPTTFEVSFLPVTPGLYCPPETTLYLYLPIGLLILLYSRRIFFLPHLKQLYRQNLGDISGG